MYHQGLKGGTEGKKREESGGFMKESVGVEPHFIGLILAKSVKAC